MNETICGKGAGEYLVFDFTYEGHRFNECVRLDEEAPDVELLYDDHDLEITWVKYLALRDLEIEVNIVLCDDAEANDLCGHVTASAFVNVYRPRADDLSATLIDAFEPDEWAYQNVLQPEFSVCKHTFYDDGPHEKRCASCSLLPLCGE